MADDPIFSTAERAAKMALGEVVTTFEHLPLPVPIPPIAPEPLFTDTMKIESVPADFFSIPPNPGHLAPDQPKTIKAKAKAIIRSVLRDGD